MKTIIILAVLILSACDYSTKPCGGNFQPLCSGPPPSLQVTVDDLQIIGPKDRRLGRSVTFHVTGDKIAINYSVRMFRRNATGGFSSMSRIFTSGRRVPFSWTYEFGAFEEGSLEILFTGSATKWRQDVTFIYEGGQ